MIIAVISQKGGVGKTSLVQNIGAELAAAGHSTLLIDYDPQSNLTTGWGLDPDADRPTIYTAMLDPEQVNRCVVALRPHLDLVPANLDLAGAELQFAGDFDRNGKLKAAIKPVAGRYRYILIDTPPSLGFFVSNALIAAQQVIIPLQAQFYALKALGPVFDIIKRAQSVNEGLKVRAIVPTMYDARNSLSEPVVNAARTQHGPLVTKTIIPVNVRIADSPIHGQPVREHDAQSSGAGAYHELAKELFFHGQ